MTIDSQKLDRAESLRRRRDEATTGATARERRALVVELRADGLTLEEIGDLIGVTRQRVWQILGGQ